MATTIEKQTWLVDTIQRHGRISLKDLSRIWEDNRSLNPDRGKLTERTFHRHREEIERIFGISIKCDKRDMNRYYIDEDESDVQGNNLRLWMLSTIAVDNLLNQSRDLRSRIQFEDIPSGQQYLSLIISCMRDGVKVELTYHSFWSDCEYSILLDPYFVKVSNQRWYVIGPSDRHPGNPHIYALDRVISIRPTGRKFKYPERFDPDEFFSNSYGIFHSEDIPLDIKIKVTHNQQKYTKSLPLHHSQRLVEETDQYCIFSYRMNPDFDLIQEIAGKGDAYEVLEPVEFRKQIARFIRNAAALYTDIEEE